VTCPKLRRIEHQKVQNPNVEAASPSTYDQSTGVIVSWPAGGKVGWPLTAGSHGCCLLDTVHTPPGHGAYPAGTGAYPSGTRCVPQWYTVGVLVVHDGCPSGTRSMSQWYMVGVPVVHGRCPGGTWSVSQWYTVGVPVVHGGCPSGTWWVSQWYMVGVPVVHGGCPSGTRSVSQWYTVRVQWYTVVFPQDIADWPPTSWRRS